MLSRKLSLIFAALAFSMLAACKSTGSVKTGATDGAQNSRNSTSDSLGVSSLRGPGPVIPGPVDVSHSVYFDFDSYSVKQEDAALLRKHADYLHKHLSKIMIQGNTDPRGSSEYNIALGQKRAEAVSKTLKSFGVLPARIETVSRGKEYATGQDEAGWVKDRRADIIYQDNQ